MKTFITWLNEQNEQKKPDVFSEKVVPYLAQEEGWRSKSYKDIYGNPTIGYGFLIDKSFDNTLQTVFPDKTPEWRQGLAAGTGEMTEDEGKAVLSHLARQKFDQAREMVGTERFDAMSPELQTHLASENYRGLLGQSKKSLSMIRSGDYKGASKEYLNSRDYLKNKDKKNSIARRVEGLSNALLQEPEWTPPTPVQTPAVAPQ